MKITRRVLLSLMTLAVASQAQETNFGKNKVQYKNFQWSYIQTRHFDLYFYDNAYPTVKFAASVMESSYVEISRELNYHIQRRVPVFVYNSHNDFQQTNIISSLIPEGVGGFTEAFKNRIVIPFSGSYEDFRHVLHHELTHAIVYDLLYGNALGSLLSSRRLFNLPLWFAEGFAEYSSRYGWDYFADMFVRDATINNYLAPPEELGGFLAYKQGQAMIQYIVDKYGEEKLGEILQRGKIHLTMSKTLKAALGITEEELWEGFSKEMKRRFWPEIAARKEPEDFAKPLTKARKDGSYFNEQPVFTPNGEELAIFTDRRDYTEIALISAADGTVIDHLVKGERSGDLESMHSYVSGMSFSPDGRSMVFVAKSGGNDAIFFLDVRSKNIYKRKRLPFHNALSPAWSPDSCKIAFSALQGFKRDLFVYDIKADEVRQLTDDRFDDLDPSWLPNSSSLVFSSDRPHSGPLATTYLGQPASDSTPMRQGDFDYGDYNLFQIDLVASTINPLDVGSGSNHSPSVSPDGRKVAFISNRNGIDNIYVAYLDSAKSYSVTDILSGVRSVSWSPDGRRLAFSAFNQGAFDVFILKELVPAGDNGVLKPTDFMLGKYEKKEKARGKATEADSTVALQAERTDTNAAQTALPDSLKADSSQLATTSDTTAQVADSSRQSRPIADSTVTKTGMSGSDYVYVSTRKHDPLDSLMVDITSDSGRTLGPPKPEPASFDSIPEPLPSGEYAIQKYKVKFTPDNVGGGFSYNTFFGLRGQSYFILSDYLGNHQIYLATDLVNTIDQSNLQAYYFNNTKRINFGGGIFHTKNFYVDDQNHLFSDRFYGFQFFVSRPQSTFSRLELIGAQYFIDRKFYDIDDLRPNRSSRITTATVSFVVDNILWGNTGPVNGRRAKVTVGGGIDLFDSHNVDFYSTEVDYRKYWHFGKTFSAAFRLAGGASFGRTPKIYFLGGTTNWIGSRALDARVYNVNNLYFSDVVTPLRGTPIYGLSGDRFGLANFEFRFPTIQVFALRFPLPIVITNVGGSIFTDIGAAWTGGRFKGGTSLDGNAHLQDIKTGFGVGMRANLMNFILLRYDLAWSTDFLHVSEKPTHYFSFGADF